MLGEECHRVASPREVEVTGEPHESSGGFREVSCRGDERREPGSELRAPIGLVEILGERGHGSAVQLEGATWVTSGCEQQLSTSEGSVHLLRVQHEIATCEESQEHWALLRIEGFRLNECGREGFVERYQTILATEVGDVDGSTELRCD